MSEKNPAKSGNPAKKAAAAKAKLESVPELTEEIQFSEQDELDMAKLLSEEPPEYHTILEVWTKVLEPAAAESAKKVTAGYASRMTQMYPLISLAQTTELQRRYYDKIEQLKAILADEVSTDKEALTHLTAETDVAENGDHYKALVRDWQLAVQQWELDWDNQDEFAAVELAAISEVHKLFFGENGILPWLDNIGFEFSDKDSQNLADALNSAREGL